MRPTQKPTLPPSNQPTPDDVFSFLKAIPNGRYRLGAVYQQWFLLLVAVLSILSGCLG